MKNGDPIEMNHITLNYNSLEKNGLIKYELESFEVDLMSNIPEYNQNTLYSTASPLVTNNTLVIKLSAKLILDSNAHSAKEYIIFRRVVFSPGMYFNSLPI